MVAATTCEDWLVLIANREMRTDAFISRKPYHEVDHGLHLYGGSRQPSEHRWRNGLGPCVLCIVAATPSVQGARLRGDNGRDDGLSSSAGRSAMTNAALEATYRAYLTALNDRRLDDLVRYV